MTDPQTQKLVESLDLEAFKNDIEALEEKILSEADMQAELRYLKRLDLFVRFIWFFGVATSFFMINPLSIFLIGMAKSNRWTILGHHILHGAFDKIEGAPDRLTSRGFARGSWRRFMDWIDWMVPSAWEFEHNALHHYHLSEPIDPDFVQKNVSTLRSRHWAMPFKYLWAYILMATWKFVYYAPNTMWYLHHKEISDEAIKKVLKDEQEFGRSFPGSRIYSPFDPVGRRYWWQCLLPYFGFNFVLVPALFLPLGIKASLFVLANMVLAELFTNIHTYMVIVTNHAGDDLPYFTTKVKSQGEFYFRQIVGSVNYRSGNEFLDFMHGYVNYQIEHHLWPRMPMRLYRKAHPQVMELCRKYNIPVVKDSVFKRMGKLLDLMVGKANNYELSTEALNKNQTVSRV